MAESPSLRRMSRRELLERQAELGHVLDVLTSYTEDQVCDELGEISYLLGQPDE